MKIVAIILLIFFCNLVSAQDTKVCLVSLAHETDLNNALPNEISDRLYIMGHKRGLSDYIKIFSHLTGPEAVYSALKNCLENPEYEEVIILSHSLKNILGHPQLVFPDKRNGEVVELGFINDRFFRTLNLGINLKQLTIIGCDSEAVLGSYSNLINLVQSRNIMIKQASSNRFLSWVRGVDNGRSFGKALNLIAESSQPKGARYLFCNYNFINGHIYSCLRSHITLHRLDRTNREGWVRIENRSDGEVTINQSAPWNRQNRFLRRDGNLDANFEAISYTHGYQYDELFTAFFN